MSEILTNKLSELVYKQVMSIPVKSLGFSKMSTLCNIFSTCLGSNLKHVAIKVDPYNACTDMREIVKT